MGELDWKFCIYCLFATYLLPLLNSLCLNTLSGDLCYPGFYYDCTHQKCIECPVDHYMDKKQNYNNATECYSHTICNSDQVVDKPGTDTSDTICKCKDGYQYDPYTETNCRWRPEEQPPTTASTLTSTSFAMSTISNIIYLDSAPTNYAQSLLTTVLVLGGIFGVLLLLAVIVCGIKRKELYKRLCYDHRDKNAKQDTFQEDNKEGTELSPLNSVQQSENLDLPDDKTEIDPKSSIKKNYLNLSKSIYQDTLFWCVLKEGGCFSRADQEKADKKLAGSGANQFVLDLAMKSKSRLDQLVLALVLTGQSHLAKYIDENQANEMAKIDNTRWKDGKDWRKRITNNYSRWIKSIKVNTSFINYLRQYDFSEDDQSIIAERESDFKVDYILEWCLRGYSKDEQFIQALRETDQGIYADFLSMNISVGKLHSVLGITDCSTVL